MLIAARDLFEIVLPILALGAFGLFRLLQGLAQVAKANQQRELPLERSAPKPPAKSNPADELERFLEEVGLRRAEKGKLPPSRKEERRPPQRKPPRLQPEGKKREALRSHHLQSDIEGRHGHVLESSLPSGPLAGRRLLPSEGQATSAPIPVATVPGQALMDLLRDRNRVAQSMILGTLLGPPPGLSD